MKSLVLILFIFGLGLTAKASLTLDRPIEIERVYPNPKSPYSSDYAEPDQIIDYLTTNNFYQVWRLRRGSRVYIDRKDWIAGSGDQYFVNHLAQLNPIYTGPKHHPGRQKDTFIIKAELTENNGLFLITEPSAQELRYGYSTIVQLTELDSSGNTLKTATVDLNTEDFPYTVVYGYERTNSGINLIIKNISRDGQGFYGRKLFLVRLDKNWKLKSKKEILKKEPFELTGPRSPMISQADGSVIFFADGALRKMDRSGQLIRTAPAPTPNYKSYICEFCKEGASGATADYLSSIFFFDPIESAFYVLAQSVINYGDTNILKIDLKTETIDRSFGKDGAYQITAAPRSFDAQIIRGLNHNLNLLASTNSQDDGMKYYFAEIQGDSSSMLKFESKNYCYPNCDTSFLFNGEELVVRQHYEWGSHATLWLYKQTQSLR